VKWKSCLIVAQSAPVIQCKKDDYTTNKVIMWHRCGVHFIPKGITSTQQSRLEPPCQNVSKPKDTFLVNLVVAFDQFEQVPSCIN